ncbi:hypothetical protein K6H11_000204 [Candida tropicalis]
MLWSSLSLALLPCLTQAYITNFEDVNKLTDLDSTPNVPGLENDIQVKTPQDLLFSGDYVCDKFASLIQSTNDTDEFPVDFNMYVSQTTDEGNNYTVDLYFKNPWHNTYNEFAELNITDPQLVLSKYNPTLISKQDFGVEFKFQFSKGLLCQFMYQFTIAYQLKHQDDDTKSDKIFLSGSCQEHARYYPEDHEYLVNKGFRCVEYNSGFKYDGGKDWCSKFYPQSQCCTSYSRDEVVDRDTCPTVSNSTDSDAVVEPIIIKGSSTIQGGNAASDDLTTTIVSKITVGTTTKADTTIPVSAPVTTSDSNGKAAATTSEFILDPNFVIDPSFIIDPSFVLDPGFVVDPSFVNDPSFVLDPGFIVDPSIFANPSFTVDPGFNAPGTPNTLTTVTLPNAPVPTSSTGLTTVTLPNAPVPTSSTGLTTVTLPNAPVQTSSTGLTTLIL